MHEILEKIQKAANNKKNAAEFTHGLYRYPASMSPMLAREIINLLTKRNDIILDPFCGGGTTAIEALLQGRKTICSDINALASFVTKAKSTPLGKDTIEKVEVWTKITFDRLYEYRKMEIPDDFKITDNLHCPKTLWLLNMLKHDANLQTDPQARAVCNLIMLNVGRLCFDCRAKSPNPYKLIKIFKKYSSLTITSLNHYSELCKQESLNFDYENDLKVFCENAIDLPKSIRSDEIKNIKLILTSPPYPGVHILYHRWQIKGRKQTALPFSLLHINDGFPASFYTLGSSTPKGYKLYFMNITNIFAGLKHVISNKAIIAQIISFKEPEWQLPMYEKAMCEAGYIKIYFSNKKEDIITREIPNRKWYTNLNSNKAFEYILFHQKK